MRSRNRWPNLAAAGRRWSKIRYSPAATAAWPSPAMRRVRIGKSYRCKVVAGTCCVMENWTSRSLVFVAGIGVGIALMRLKPYIFVARKRRTELVAARSRILAGIKEKHEEEILDE